MASNYMDLLSQLRLYCYTFEDLESYVKNAGIDPNCEAVITRRNELFSNNLITDTDMYRLLFCCCHTLDELNTFIEQQGIDRNDPGVQARARELQVCETVLKCTLTEYVMLFYVTTFTFTVEAV